MPTQTKHTPDEVDRLSRELDALRKESSLQAATIELLEAENERLHALLLEGGASPQINA